jgi:hypothetical protein
MSPGSSGLLDSPSIDKQQAVTRSGSTPETNRYTTLPNHPGDMPEGTVRAILRQADIDPEVFLKT